MSATRQAVLGAMVGELLEVGEAIHVIIKTRQDFGRRGSWFITRRGQVHRFPSEQFIKVARVGIGRHLRLEGWRNLSM